MRIKGITSVEEFTKRYLPEEYKKEYKRKLGKLEPTQGLATWLIKENLDPDRIGLYHIMTPEDYSLLREKIFSIKTERIFQKCFQA